MSNPLTFVAVESTNDGEVSWLAGPFENGDEAEEWRNKFIEEADYDEDFVYVVWSSTPEEVLKAHVE